MAVENKWGLQIDEPRRNSHADDANLWGFDAAERRRQIENHLKTTTKYYGFEFTGVSPAIQCCLEEYFTHSAHRCGENRLRIDIIGVPRPSPFYPEIEMVYRDGRYFFQEREKSGSRSMLVMTPKQYRDKIIDFWKRRPKLARRYRNRKRST